MSNSLGQSRSPWLKLLGFLVILALGYLIGLASAPAPASQSVSSLLRQALGVDQTAKNSELLSNVLEQIEKNYLNQPVDQQQLLYGALEGLVRSLGDPYSAFFPPQETEQFRELVEGSFEGIGAEIGVRTDRLTVIAPLKDSPAEAAGVRAGDVIVAIDDQPTETLTLDEAVSLLRGEKGTKVTIVVSRDGLDNVTEITITRDTIRLTSVESSIKQTPKGEAVGYLELSHFTAATDDEFKEAVTALALANPRGYIIDMRNNPGGFLDSAITILGHFIGSEVAVIEEFNDRKQVPHHADGNADLADVPIVVLVNAGSASASEIVAGALADHEVATIIGTNTFGKGSVQKYEELNDGSSLKLTVARSLTPDGRTIEGNGIVPDIVVEYTEGSDAPDEQLNRALQEIERQCCSA